MKTLRHLLWVAVLLAVLVVSPVEAWSTMTVADACGFSSVDEVVVTPADGGSYIVDDTSLLTALLQADGVTAANVNEANYLTTLTVNPSGATVGVYWYPNNGLRFRVKCGNGTILRTNDPVFGCLVLGECHTL